jgi:hypothetical protein
MKKSLSLIWSGGIRIWLWLILALALTTVCRAEPDAANESLRGLKGLYVVSQFIDLQPEGLTTNGIVTMAKTALHNAGIPVNAEPKSTNGNANLSITISTVNDTQHGLYLFTVEVAVIQDAQLTRQAQASPMPAQTWSKTIQGLTAPDGTDVIEQALKQCMDQFVTSYRAVNPRRLLAPPAKLNTAPVQ